MTAAQAYEPCVMNLRSDSRGGVEIRVSFFAEFRNDRFYPVQIKAEIQGREPKLNTTQRVNLYLNWNPGYRNTRVDEFHLFQTSGRPAYFHAELGAKGESIGINATPRIQHVSVTVEGISLIDPLTGRDYFEVSFENAMRARSFACVRK